MVHPSLHRIVYSILEREYDDLKDVLPRWSTHCKKALEWVGLQALQHLDCLWWGEEMKCWYKQQQGESVIHHISIDKRASIFSSVPGPWERLSHRYRDWFAISRWTHDVLALFKLEVRNPQSASITWMQKPCTYISFGYGINVTSESKLTYHFGFENQRNGCFMFLVPSPILSPRPSIAVQLRSSAQVQKLDRLIEPC
jgi:hypothetical protein